MKTPPAPQTRGSSAAFQTLNRRNFLRGLGACLALPTFESLSGLPQLIADPSLRPLATTPSGAPLRLAFVYFPNGAIQDRWWPEQQGEHDSWQLNQTMEPLSPVKHQLQVLGGLDHVNATPGPDGAGDHARASGTFLTGVRVKKTAGADIQAGISIDQVLAQHIGHLTRFPSLELTCDAVRKSGNCDSGYSCAYQYNLSWRSASQPMPPEPNPRLLFERLFGAGTGSERAESLARRHQRQNSLLDFVLQDAKSLQQQLNYKDQQKLNEYMESVRAIEKRIEQAERFGPPPNPQATAPTGIPDSFEAYLQVMFDLAVLAFQTDSTRLATFLMQNEGSNRPFPEIRIAEGHHYLTHHRNQTDMIDKVAQIDRWYMEKFAYFLKRLEECKDVDGQSVLHNSMIVYGSGNSDGNRHTHTNLPILLAGSGGGTLMANRHTQFNSIPMSNMLLGLADRMGVNSIERLGDSTGHLTAI